MNIENAEFERLNAYVDGELDSAEAADVALAIAGNPRLAQQVAALTRLRSAVIEVAETPAIDLLRDPAERKGPGRRMLAAGIAFLIFLAGSILLFSSDDRSTPLRWFEVTASFLENWPDKPDRPDRNALSMAGLRPAGSLARVYVPDLSAAKLTINHVVKRPESPMGGLTVIGYRGTRGCRVVLAVFADGGSFPIERTLVRKKDIRAYTWRAGRWGYAIIADGMDVPRFRLIAKTVHEMTLRHQPADTETRVALGESRRRGAPCLT